MDPMDIVLREFQEFVEQRLKHSTIAAAQYRTVVENYIQYLRNEYGEVKAIFLLRNQGDADRFLNEHYSRHTAIYYKTQKTRLHEFQRWLRWKGLLRWVLTFVAQIYSIPWIRIPIWVVSFFTGIVVIIVAVGPVFGWPPERIRTLVGELTKRQDLNMETQSPTSMLVATLTPVSTSPVLPPPTSSWTPTPTPEWYPISESKARFITGAILGTHTGTVYRDIRALSWYQDKNSNSQFLAIASSERITIWDFTTTPSLLPIWWWQYDAKTPYLFPGTITSLAWSPDGDMLAVSLDEGGVAVLDVKTPSAPQLKKIYSYEEPNAKAQILSWFSDGSGVMLGGGYANSETVQDDGWVAKLIFEGDRLTRYTYLNNHTRWVRDIDQCFAMNKTGYATASSDGSFILWDKNGDYGGMKSIIAQEETLGGRLLSIAWQPSKESRDCKLLAVGGQSGKIYMFNVSGNGVTFQNKKQIEPSGYGINDIAWSPDGTLLASASGIQMLDGPHGEVLLLNPSKLEPISVPNGQDIGNDLYERVQVISFSPDGRFLVAGLRDGTIRYWEARNRSLD